MFKLSSNQGTANEINGLYLATVWSARQGQQERREPGAELDGGEGLEPLTMARARSPCAAGLSA